MPTSTPTPKKDFITTVFTIANQIRHTTGMYPGEFLNLLIAVVDIIALQSDDLSADAATRLKYDVLLHACFAAGVARRCGSLAARICGIANFYRSISVAYEGFSDAFQEMTSTSPPTMPTSSMLEFALLDSMAHIVMGASCIDSARAEEKEERDAIINRNRGTAAPKLQ